MSECLKTNEGGLHTIVVNPNCKNPRAKHPKKINMHNATFSRQACCIPRVCKPPHFERQHDEIRQVIMRLIIRHVEIEPPGDESSVSISGGFSVDGAPFLS